ncbi:MAG: SDR family oxidoreductase [Spirochaetales bacterium]|nr:SDR family oxidoreductase [Spirochaetales bacterium]
MKIRDKVICVSGAGGGVGRELVLHLLCGGASVAAVDINSSALTETKMMAGKYAGKLSIHTADIRDTGRVCALAAEIAGRHGGIDILINNAGIIQPFVTMPDLSLETVKRVMDINFYGMMNMTRAFLPWLAKQEEACIANVSSMGGFLPVPGQSVYGASKAAVKLATESMRLEHSHTVIRVSLIIPGGIETDIKSNSGLKEEGSRESQKNKSGMKLTSPSRAALTIIEGIEKERAKILIGKDARIMDILYRIMPLKAADLISRVMEGNHSGIFNTTENLQEGICREARA